ncbi:undecaprenyldiphospho-muramoylpentapeptide beta-N-acetylglucosaminyltransferase [Merismopedia glauca]|uniref:UDP-N-acetylglucosamine--N-acetylmuramyl-(pentapeptide) pyrophosphoryl-undecaprenol N-acetylglucosamine transferase n=1 Tax=Merismopedia glauca CCAP 1448/3 TaxID=1296344 RepID=A0A2T1C591_9CYAN|nr:undecaprenyldiphospho-muramoylpentapeptide beta-N-acetylglucosaminyltransferase [Merismopedia glauca]PSB03328.1 undecaprenyldiphospho-muramoylpentapeptide beta-N-acetylglucosaminyltransferase [Merismopedia glauca CCAP 1448/3]
MSQTKKRLLIAASGTGGHLFPALALAKELQDYHIEWLGVPNRLETQLVPTEYKLHQIAVTGFQEKFGLGTIKIALRLVRSIWQVRQILQKGQFDGVFTTGGYIASPAILAAKSLGLPSILHEANAIPGKVTRFLGNFCSIIAVGFEPAAKHLSRYKTLYVGTPVRPEFLSPQKLDLPIPDNVPLIVVAGGSQGAVAVNQLVRQCAAAWFEAGAWIVHLTGENDPDANSLQHPQYLVMPFYQDMAALWQRANLAISRAGGGTLSELAVTKTPAILIPYPFAAEDHQTYNAKVFVDAGAALVFQQQELSHQILEKEGLKLLNSPENLQEMAKSAADVAFPNSTQLIADLVRKTLI